MNIDITPDWLATMATQALQLDPPPTEEEINQVLNRLAMAFAIDDSTVAGALKLLHARFRIRMEMGQTIQEDYVPWLDARRASIDPFYWSRYHQFLLRSGWSPRVAGTLDRSMDELLDLLGNPADVSSWKRRGLVVGDVQSGKTASYSALICKAADAGYKMVILLTGTLENVRRQTQERLDAAFVGLDSRAFLAKGQLRQKTLIGVGQIDGRRNGVVFTSRASDFRKANATALNISLEAVREPVLVVTKKNKSVLGSLATWLRGKNADRAGHIDLPLLLIDDEADNASINTIQNATEAANTTAINAAIRDLLALFRRSSYVGFTATPFANIFIDPLSATTMLGDDLFPKDFIHLLEPPSNYVGMNSLFLPADPDRQDDADNQGWIAGLRTIEDTDDWLPLDHKQDVHPGPIPESLITALRLFALSCAIRDLRVLHMVDGCEKGIHRSMMVNVSRFTAIQNQIAGDIHAELEQIRQKVRLYGNLPPRQASESKDIRALEELFDTEFSDCGFGWPTVLAALHESVSPIRVQAVNQGTGAASLDFSAVETAPGVRVIAVGGNSLSRGLTIEGLCVSYILRNSKAYDTLLQMGRWFGYRDGYSDLCRLYLTEEAEGWNRHVVDATNELKRDFARMRRQKATPAEFGLRVRTHPDTLLITARNKMATGIEVVDEVRDISLTGRGIETSRLYSDRKRNEANLALVDRFLAHLIDNFGQPEPSLHGSAVIWSGISAALVGQLVADFLVHPLNHDFQGDAISDFLAEAIKRADPQLSSWTIALPTKGEGDLIMPPLRCGIPVAAKKRRVLPRTLQSLLVSGKKARVGSRTDVKHGLTVQQVEEVTRAERQVKPDTKDIPEDAYRSVMSNPVLIIYLLRGVEKNGEGETIYKEGLVLPALGLHFPGAKDKDAPKRYLKYRLNRVAQEELEWDGDDIAEEPYED
jgi:hypothetical protein